jgi:hypothetical protein
MEASEKPQLPLEPDARGDGSVRLVEDRIVIERMEIADRGTARVVRDQFKEGREPVETVTRAIEIGARVIESEGTAANVDFVNAQFERHVGGLAEQLSELLQTGNDELAQQLVTNFGADQTGSVQAQIRDMLVKANEHQRTEMVRLFNAEEGANPLSDFKTSITAKVAEAAQRAERQSEALRESHSQESKELRDQVALLKTEVARLTERKAGDELLEEAEAAGTRKGRTFEERVHEVIDSIATARGDVAMAVGDQAGETRGKKGDTVVELGAAAGTALAKIAFDPKDSNNLTRPKAWTVLNGSLEDRGADYAVLVVAGEHQLPAKTQSLVEYEGNKLIVAVDCEEPERFVLEAAYCLARARALATRKDELTLDSMAMKEAVEEARRALESVKTARQALTGLRKNADSIESALATVEDGTKEALGRVDSLIADALEADA